MAQNLVPVSTSSDAWIIAGANSSERSLEFAPAMIQASLDVDTGTRFWAIGLGEGGRLWNKCQEQGIAAIGWDDLGDLSKYTDQEAIAQAMRQRRGPDQPAPHNDSRACYEFVHKMRPGD